MQIPKAFFRETNLVESRALVKISANCFSVVMCSITTVLFSTNSLIKWCRMSICFVLEWSRSSDNYYQLIQSINEVVDDFNDSVGISIEVDTICLTDKAEYIDVGSCYTQLLSMKQMLEDYGIFQDTLYVYCDNTSAINISKNPV